MSSSVTSDVTAPQQPTLIDTKASESASRKAMGMKDKRSVGEKILSFMFDGPSGTKSARLERELRELYQEDQADNPEVPRTEKEERERRRRMQRRREIVGGGDGLRSNDLQKEGWGGAVLAGSA